MSITADIGQFMDGLVTAYQLRQRAEQNGFFIEYICLVASIIDGHLRMGLIFTHQLKTGSSELLEELLQQTDDGPIINEHEIYKRAKQQGVIDDDLFNKLESLYKKRNRVIHRYIISGLTTYEVLQIAVEFEQILPTVETIVGNLEAKQEQLGIGMSRSGEMPGMGRRLGDMSANKHGNPVLAKRLLDGES
jgi:hypothetical protein